MGFGRRLIFFALVMLAHSFQARCQERGGLCDKLNSLIAVMERNHVKPVQWDQKRSFQAFLRFLKVLDPRGLYLLEIDKRELTDLWQRMDLSGSSSDCRLLDELSVRYAARLNTADSLLNAAGDNPFNFSLADSMLLFYGAVQHAQNKVSFKEKWDRWLKYRLLKTAYSQTSRAETVLHNPDSFTFYEPAWRKLVLHQERCEIQRKLAHPEGFKKRIGALLLNTIASSYDPHSAYFSEEDKRYFESSVSKESYSLGLNLGVGEQGEIVVESLVPGGPAWKSNMLNKGDRLLQMKWHGISPIDLSCLDRYEVEEMVRSSKGYALTLTVRKASGKVRKVTLIKEKLEADDNRITSFILRKDRPVGYIALPGFYSNTGRYDAPGCANDVAKEIIKLQQDKIEGLILDLRNNGGGSMVEALDLAGLFINEGPLSIYQSGEGERPHLLKDSNRGTLYRDPLVVLVNGHSASASEIFAAALQDYHRAVIAGSPTFGKASGQVILPLDPDIDLESYNFSPSKTGLGYVKLSVSRFYRLSGSTYQRAGVIPDVLLPDFVDRISVREEYFPTAFSIDRVEKKVLFQPLPALPVKALQALSNQRVEADSIFQQMEQLNDLLINPFLDASIIPLKPKDYAASRSRVQRLTHYIESSLENTVPRLAVTNSHYKTEILKLSDFYQKANETLRQNIEQDIYIAEAYNITNDLIRLNKQ